jgi:hypothetical protein
LRPDRPCGPARDEGGIGLNANPVVHGRVDDSFLANDLIGSYNGRSFTADGFGQDRMTVLAGRLPAAGSDDQIALTAQIARLFGVGVGGRVTYQFYRQDPATYQSYPDGRHTFLVTAIVDIPPVLVDQSDQKEAGVLPPGATRRLLASYVYAWVGVRLARGPAGIPQLQHRLAALAVSVQRQVLLRTHQKLPGLTFNITRSDIIRDEVQQAIRPQAVALAVFGVIAALAMLVLVGQGLAPILSRAGPDIAAARALGATRVQAALAIALPGCAAVVAGVILAVAGAVALSPLAPVGPVRQFDPVLGLERNRGSVEPPTTTGQSLSGDDQIELGTLTLRQLGKHIGDTVVVGVRPYRRSLTIVGTVTLPSFGLALTDHVSLGRGACCPSRPCSRSRARPTRTRSRRAMRHRLCRPRSRSTWFPAPARRSGPGSCGR